MELSLKTPHYLAWDTAPIVASGWRLVFSLQLADNRLSTGLKAHCSANRDLALDGSRLVLSLHTMKLWPFLFQWDYKDNQSFRHLSGTLGLFQFSTLTLPWPNLDQGNLENKMLKFSFSGEQCHISQLKNTCSQHKLPVQLTLPLNYIPPCFII